MDLDEEELKATWDLHGINKRMSEEEIIERCNELIKEEHCNWIGISNQKAIERNIRLIPKRKREK